MARNVQLKPIDQQVIVITGASSGIGLATARMAAERGAKVVLTARSADALEQITREMHKAGYEAMAVPCDVANRAEVDAVARTTVARFGRIDTWVNDAGVSIFGRLDQTSEADARRLFDTNFWGLVNGCMVALEHLRGQGGAIINIGSEVSEAVIPMEGMYSASKHAVKGFNDALRIEVEEVDELPISITLIQPTAVDTPFPQHALNLQPQDAKLSTPMIEPEKVAEAILDAAVHPTRAKKVGAMARVNTMVAKHAPALGDKMASKQYARQHADRPAVDPQGALHRPSQESRVVGQTHGLPQE